MGGLPLPNLSAGPSYAQGGTATSSISGDFRLVRSGWQDQAATLAALVIVGVVAWRALS